MQNRIVFPSDFVWGVATSAYQIEGGIDVDGKTPSIWDTFCHRLGTILNGDTGDISADHYHYWKDDVALMAKLGIQSYRFSLAWTRIIKEDGTPNSAGLAFYDQLIDELLKYHIEPAITLYHWDLPQSLQDKGGWASRETVDAFVYYATIAFNQYNNRVKIWITHNEPSVVASYGHLYGIHAPGIVDPVATFSCIHHLLLSHGKTVQTLRALNKNPQTKFGIAVNMSAVHPENPGLTEDLIAAKIYDARSHRVFLDPLFNGLYPKDTMEWFSSIPDLVHENDMQMINAPIDFLGLNYYSRTVVRGQKVDGAITSIHVPKKPNPYSLIWDYYPEGLQEVIEDIWESYAPKEILITENGTAINDIITSEGIINDEKRIEYITAHLKVIHRLLQSSIPIKGYYVWSLLDNFEWALGYSMRFGIVYVDYQTLKRTIKASGYWYKKVAKNHGLTF